MARPKSNRNCRGLYTKKIKVGTSITGESIYKVFTSKESKAKACEKANQYLIQQALDESAGLTNENVKFRHIAEIVLALKKGTIKEETWQWSWKSHLEKHILPYFGDALIRNIHKNDIDLYFKTKGEEYSLNTLRKHRQILAAIFDNALDNGYINYDPMKNQRVRYGEKPKERLCYTKEQCEMILNFCYVHRYGYEIYLLITCGLRRSELLGLKWNCVNFKKKYIDIRESVTVSSKKRTGEGVYIGEPKNKYSKRKVAISDETVNLLKFHQRSSTSEYVVHTKAGTVIRPDSWVRSHFNIFMRDMQAYYRERDIEIPLYTAHETGRHTLASLFMNAGIDVAAITHQMGWANSDMLLEVYGHDNIDDRRKLLAIDEVSQEIS